MRIKSILLVFAIPGLLMFYGCYDTFNCESARGPILIEEVPVEPFDGISFDVAGNVYIRQDTVQRVVVETYENILPRLNTSVREGIWNIRFRDCFNRYNKFDVYISVPDLNTIVLSGAGNITGETAFETDRMDISLLGSGNITLEFYGDIIDAEIPGSGNITLWGETDQFVSFISGSGNIVASDLEANTCQVTISGSGNCEVFARESLDVVISGSGSVRYKGDPPSINSTITGSGSIVPID